jgi:hypothetical protein
VLTSFDEWDSQSKTKADVITEIDNIPYWGGSTNTVQSLDQTIALFEQQTSVYSSRVLIMITDGVPYGNFDTCVCCKAPKLKQLGVTTIIIGVGQFDAAKMDCLVEDPSYIIYLPSYDPNAINTILPILTDVTCPVQYNLKLTEVQLDQDAGVGSQFVEFYNEGTAVHMQDLSLSGIFSGPVTNTAGVYLQQGQYLVVYNADVDTPSCEDCLCPLSGNWCSDAVYMPCGSAYSCSFDASGMDNTNWWVNATDSTDGKIVDWLLYGSGWPSILTGYTFELEWVGYNNHEGSNWHQSCNTRGTPGYEPIRNCSWTCTDEQCQLNGASEATCTSSGNSKCNCNPNLKSQYNSYYFSGTTCYEVPPPQWCYAYWLKNDTNQQRWVRFEWGAAQTDNAVNYSLQYYTDQGSQDIVQTTSRTKNVVDYDYTRNDIDNQYAGNVRTKIGDAKSTSVSCEQITQAPTPSPTDMPTQMPSRAPSRMPTAAPTWGDRSCWLAGDICELDRCDCGDTDEDYYDDNCEGNEVSKNFAASESNQFITVKRRPPGYPGANCFKWAIELLDDNYDNQNDQGNNNNAQRRLLQYATTDMFMETTLIDEGIGIVPTRGDLCANDSDEVKISILIQKREVANGRSRYNLYRLSLYDPDTDMDPTFRLIYPSNLMMIVDITGGESITSTRSEKQMPVWAWILIAAMVLFLALLAWLVYKYWWKQKRTSADLAETENELEHAYKENEDGWAGDLKQGDVTFNPIATGNPNVQTAPQMQTGLMDGDGSGQQIARADVVVEKFNERQEIAGNMGQRHHQY